jgi:hypothetical protein
MKYVIAMICALLWTTEARAAPDAPFAAMQPLLGKVWHGVPTNIGARAEDLSKWEMILDGGMLRITHAFGDGTTGGETLIYWDRGRERLASITVSTDGYRAEGLFEILSDNRWRLDQEVTGDPQVQRLRIEGTLQSDGQFTTQWSYLKDGVWVDGDRFEYREMAGL